MNTRLLLAVASMSALLSGCGGGGAPPQRIRIQEASLEFPLSKSMSATYFMGSPSFKWKGRSSSFSVGERSTNWSPYAATLSDEVRQFQAGVPHCVLTSEIRMQRLTNGWECAWAEMLCHESVPSPHIVCEAEARRYVVSVSGKDYSIPEILEFVGAGRVVPADQRAAILAEAEKKSDPMREIDRISGGPQIRLTLLAGVLAWIGLMFACVFLWRGRKILRVAAVLLGLVYAMFFGPFWVGLVFSAFLGVPLFGIPGPVVVTAALGVMLLSLGVAARFARSSSKS